MADTIAFPSVAWFQRLAQLMHESRARQIQLGYVDCTVLFTVSDGGAGGRPWSALVTFEEFDAVDVREAGPADAASADFALEAPLATWREMIESIAVGGGRPDLEHTLNRLSHLGEPLRVTSDDVLKKDLYFRFNQSLQEFVNASANFRTQIASP
ncbi:MAG: hypothetical protein FJ108_03230 [Deltaproteobacteria bacterium]|nr:hypothetical protein [Deltaproteobacteria bacterium]